MCDYSLHAVTSRPATIGDSLVTTRFAKRPARNGPPAAIRAGSDSIRDSGANRRSGVVDQIARAASKSNEVASDDL